MKPAIWRIAGWRQINFRQKFARRSQFGFAEYIGRRHDLQQMRSESAGGVVFDGRGRAAIVLQRDRSGRLRWTLPKGRLEPGETPLQAARREVYEETGLVVRIARALGIYEGKRRRTHYFHMNMRADHGVFDNETEELRFVSLSRARRLLRSRRDRLVLSWAAAAVGDTWWRAARELRAVG
jgi:8-oxo-dGTP pyrophosphatase MutT (NUDIX family)